MTDLTELQRLAEGASAGEGQSQYTHPRDSNNWKANAAFVQAFDADTAKKLIAVARAAQDLNEMSMSLALFTALEELK